MAMRPEDLAMGEAAESSQPRLSLPEQELGAIPEGATASRDPRFLDEVEDWLYYHLDTARTQRMRMDRMVEWNSAYVEAHRRWQNARTRARLHHERLEAANRPVSGLISQMMTAEGL